MAFKEGNRYQSSMLPASIEDYVGADDIVRFYDSYVNELDLEKLGFDLNSKRVGNSSYHPSLMLKILLYAYSYGWRSSRKIERELTYNLSFIWLSEGLKPDARTICEFRKNNLEVFKKIMKEGILLLNNLGLLERTELFIDGTKIRGNSSLDKDYTKKGLLKFLQRVDIKIDSLLSECEKVDAKESKSLIKMECELSSQEKLRDKIRSSLKEIDRINSSLQGTNNNTSFKRTKINLTDNDAVNYKNRQGYHSGYNVQSSVDGKHGLIVNVDAESKGTDSGSLEKQVEDSIENIGKNPDVVCTDGGYSQGSDVKPIHDKGIKTCIPSKLQIENERKKALGRETKKFTKEEFNYDKEGDFYLCPQGHKLTFRTYRKGSQSYGYKIEDKELCIKCEFFGECTNSNREGRTISRSIYEEAREESSKFYASEEGQKIYKRRKHLAETPFGHIKSNMNFNRFFLRGINGANAEISIMASCYNITRMINLLGGVEKAIQAIKNLNKNQLESYC